MVVRASATAVVQQVMIESPLAAGTEAREYLSGADEDKAWDYWYCRRELRDDRVSVAANALDAEPQEFEFYLRPTLPGTYHVLPAEAFAMYEPARRGFSPPLVLRVEANESLKATP